MGHNPGKALRFAILLLIPAKFVSMFVGIQRMFVCVEVETYVHVCNGVCVVCNTLSVCTLYVLSVICLFVHSMGCLFVPVC